VRLPCALQIVVQTLEKLSEARAVADLRGWSVLHHPVEVTTLLTVARLWVQCVSVMMQRGLLRSELVCMCALREARSRAPTSNVHSARMQDREDTMHACWKLLHAEHTE
jgi:hypothetical protein